MVGSYEGRVVNGQIKLDKNVVLPEGARVIVTVLEANEELVRDSALPLRMKVTKDENLD
jgi:hypothetical protein